MISKISKNDMNLTKYQIHIKILENSELSDKNIRIEEGDKEILTINWFVDIVYIKNKVAIFSKKLLNFTNLNIEFFRI